MSKKENLKEEEALVLDELEKIIGESLPIIEDFILGDGEFPTIPSLGVKIDGKNIVGLSLCHENIKNLPKSIKTLKSLKTLVLGYIWYIPGFQGDIEFERWGHSGLEVLPESIGNLKSLNELILCCHFFDSLPESIGNLKSLQTLDLHFNKLSKLPESIGNLKSLQKLDLRWNRFKEIPKEIWSLTNLKELKFDDKFTNFDPVSRKRKSDFSQEAIDEINSWRNPLDLESKELVKNSIPVILETLRKKSTIHVFLSHAVQDYDSGEYLLKELIENLESEDQIYKVYHCERDMAGSIDEFMQEFIEKSQLVLFLATNKSVLNSRDCRFEMIESIKQNKAIIPLRGFDVRWSDLAEIKDEEGKSLGIERLKGMDIPKQDREKGLTNEVIESFSKDLYKYIKQYKQDFNLF